jgi:hypothetical protein
MNFYNLLVGGITVYKYSQTGIYWYHAASTTTATLFYINSWYKYFKGTDKEKFKIITVVEHDDEWIEIKNIK